MGKSQLLTLKEAAAALGVDEKAVQAQLAAGQLKGEKKSAWLQDKWFVDKGEVDELVAQKKRKKTNNTKTDNGSTPETRPGLSPEIAHTFDLRSFGDGKSIGTDKALRTLAQKPSNVWLGSERDRLHMVVEQVMRPLIEKVASQAQLLAEKDRIIEEQASRLKLLPDLEKQAAAEREARETIVNLLQERNTILERESKQADIAREKVGELRSALEKLEQAESENKAATDRLKKEKESQIAVLEEQLGFLAFQLEQARTPWWKKIFPSSNRHSITS